MRCLEARTTGRRERQPEQAGLDRHTPVAKAVSEQRAEPLRQNIESVNSEVFGDERAQAHIWKINIVAPIVDRVGLGRAVSISACV